MPRYEHIKLVKRIDSLGVLPKNSSEYTNWVKAVEHLELLQNNANEDELVVFAMNSRTLIQTLVISEDCIRDLDRSVLLDWSGSSYSSCARYGCDKDGPRIYRDSSFWRHESLTNARQLVFVRELVDSNDGHYCEILQEYKHLAGIHWRPERHAYCCFDEQGDWEHVVSVTQDKHSGLDIVTFKRQQLEKFLTVSNSVLIRMFEFRLSPQVDSIDWTAEVETVNEDVNFFYHRRIEPDKAGYYRGIQIIRPSCSPNSLFSLVDIERTGGKKNKYVEFTAWDCRHGCIATISTDPSATTNYFITENDLPFTTSSTFFRPEVMSKYKNDPDKYTIDEEHRTIRCRDSWSLRSYDVNEAGQVHAYICDLMSLPYSEQQYWKSFNEEPKTGISQRALTNDFEGEFSDITTSLEDLLYVVRRWSEMNVQWWHLRERELDENIHVPNNRNEWAQSFLGVAKLVIEGFRNGDVFYNILKKAGKENNEDKGKSIMLVEKVLIHKGKLAADTKLDGLRTIQSVRSKCGAHPRGNEAIALEKKAEKEYGSFSNHFEHVCRKTVKELAMIESIFQ